MRPESSTKRYYRVDRREMHYLKCLLEGYEGMAVMTTLDPKKGSIVLRIGPGSEREVDLIVGDLKTQIRIESAEKGETLGLK